MTPLRMKLSVVIPVYNEEQTIESLVERVDRVPVDKEIVIVDDCSTDGTRAKLDLLASRSNVRVFHHEVNRGKGAALRTGFAQARGDLVVVQDADLEYDPGELPKLIEPILDGRADVVFGSRFAGGQSHRVLYYWHSLGNRFLTALSNMFTNLNLTDMETCYKVFRREILQSIPIEENRFGFEPEITAKIASLGCRVYEVGISYRGRTYEEGKKIGWKDGVRALWCILKYNSWKRLDRAAARVGPERSGGPAPETLPRTAGVGWGFWLLGLAVTLIVAFCTSHRDEVAEADAWEHHRAVKVLAEEWPRPANPTMEAPEPSIRYSPYSVALALVCRRTGMDPWTALSGAAVLNTGLFVIALHLLLRVYGQTAAGACVLLTIVALYGGTPGYANSLALADLPLMQVNPSAFATALAFLSWALFRRWADPAPRPWIPPVLGLLLAVTLLSHGITGVLCIVGLGAIIVTAPTRSRFLVVGGGALVVVLGVGLSLAWPWFSFWQALRMKPDNDYWFMPQVLKLMVTQWCVPAAVVAVAVLPWRRTELERWSFAGAAACGILTVLAVLLKSATFARAPLVGLVFLQIPIGLFAWTTGIFRPSTWPGRLSGLFSRSPATGAPAAVETLGALTIAACLLAQVFTLLREPHLARAYVAPLLRYENKQRPLKPLYEELLRGVGSHDVVLADSVTGWPVPSVRGRVVLPEHYEFFVPGQLRREEDVAAFFDPSTPESRRREVVERYQVRWILINRKRQEDRASALLVVPSAVVRGVDGIILLDAAAWRKGRP